MDYPVTPDGRYFVARGRLWRCTDPSLPEDERQAAVRELMSARRAVRDAKSEAETKAARARVDAAKRRLGERGPVWWSDGAADEGGRAPKNSSYADWWDTLGEAGRAPGMDKGRPRD
ncbi:hypothetical protein [Wenxinia marina]|uniref:Uncharacterized protein n=1 Tax=Wenxinia marina DSM 24838 TaxID=1123501 RepID=A0A0D0NM31_9RHOB|nr:hypothetical protein [Wenxinia marina]KIQ69345.1 hypothetical protein Wenmar_01707 [Wenxinia marina DSM 24838]GGL57595.1 hypothetical protein GCM10011392_10030 [Wenxinia marina]